MGSQDLYTVSWEKFSKSLMTTLQVLRDNNEMMDVTLAAGGKTFPAHKLVLSAASPLLKELIKSTPCHHPVVVLAGISAMDLEALLQFVYQGEVSVDPTQLPSLLRAANSLDILGFCPLNSNEPTTPHPEPLKDSELDVPPNAELKVSHVMSLKLSTQGIRSRKKRKYSESSKVKKEMSHGVGEEQSSDGQTQGFLEGDMLMDSLSGYDEQVPTTSPEGQGRLLPASEQPCVCSLCGMTIRQARNLRRHMLGCPYRPIPDVECTANLILPSQPHGNLQDATLSTLGTESDSVHNVSSALVSTQSKGSLLNSKSTS